MDKLKVFNQHRPLLFSIAYNMLGTTMDAEDIVQETYLRWQTTSEVESPKAYLASIATNLAINHLRSAKIQREEYFGPWLPEPIVTGDDNPHHAAELAETLSVAFLVMLESCTPHERAALLLRQVFDYDYIEIASILGKTETACRQLVSRAKRRIAAQRHITIKPTTSDHDQVVSEFIQACVTGDMPKLMDLLAIDCVSRSDGGGKASTAIYPLIGAKKVALFIMGVIKKAPANATARIMKINASSGIVGYSGVQPFVVITFDVVDDKIQNVYHILNPDKLTSIPPLRAEDT